METKRNSVVGVIAHVDAGKTTLCEAMLWLSGKIRKQGRVDHRDSFFDSNQMERERGITIFSKQSPMPLEHTTIWLLDTPGHVDFSAETESTLRVTDCCVLVISGTDGVQAHTETLWQLLRHLGIPTFLFITKMDLPGPGKAALMAELKAELGDGCIDFSADNAEKEEQLAVCSESAMERYLENGSLTEECIAELVASGAAFPCFFGSGLKTEGVEELLSALDRYAPQRLCGQQFGASVYKIDRDSRGSRQTYLRITGGHLSVRDTIAYADTEGVRHEEKISALRVYSGEKFEAVETAEPGMLCAVTGLSATFRGQGLGAEPDASAAQLEPVLRYCVQLPVGTDAAVMLPKLMQLNEEEPMLQLAADAKGGAIHVSLMGEVQAEIFRRMVADRFDVEITLDHGSILYKETIADKVEGIGHFEPLRHYAEVHLLLEPGKRGSGIVLQSACPEDALDRNWQRLILTHLAERSHPGVLTGSPLTDVSITLAAGKAHLKHTEGGDFRQATYRAVRQGLMQAESILLEPYYDFTLAVPPDQIGRAISDIRAMGGSFSSPEELGGLTRLTGSAPVSEMNGYVNTVLAYTRGRGRLSVRSGGYLPCHNTDQVLAELAYDPETDTDNPAGSVFCAHGAGFYVPWDKVTDYMHLESCLRPLAPSEPAVRPVNRSVNIDDRELEAIMEREFGPIRRREYGVAVRNEAMPEMPQYSERKDYIIVDGYNLLFAWEKTKKLAEQRLDLARSRLMDALSNYAGSTGAELVLVFDAYRTPDNPGTREEYHNIRVVYTKTDETGDAYIERLADEIGHNYRVRVVTSDNLIRLSALRSGVLRTSSSLFAAELEEALRQLDRLVEGTNAQPHSSKIKEVIGDGE